MQSVPRLIAILNGTHREARILAARRLGQLQRHDALLAVSSHPDPLLRIAVAQALGERCPTVYAKDESRDVRIAAASVLRGPVLVAMLRDKNWRVRAAAARSLGHAGIGIEELASRLGSRTFAVGIAAFESLERIGPRSALAVGRMVDNGNEAVWHYAPKLFDSYGGSGAAGVLPLIDALRHPNPAARECAARCLGAVGQDAERAVPALMTALSDRRLAVVSHAALALGKIGLSEPLLAGLAHPRARVRAYSAFAIGWALAAKRGFDQAPFEPRLPVLDCGEPEPAVALNDLPNDHVGTPQSRKLARAGIWSKDKRLAYRSVAALDYDQMSPLECARAVELVMAEGFRQGHPFSFSHFRSYVGSNELPAVLQMVFLARECDPKRRSIFGDFHRSSRAEHIPSLRWFERNEDELRQEGIGNLWQPFFETARYRDSESSGDLWKDIEEAQGIWDPLQWWLEDEPIPVDREAPLIRLADDAFRATGQHRDRQQRSALRALGRASGDESLRYLRWFSERDGRSAAVACASLARRGDPDALVRMVAKCRTDSDALPLLLEMRPELGLALARAQFSDSASADECADAFGHWIGELDAALGVRWDPDRLIGIEPAIPAGVLRAETLLAIIRRVPGCSSRRLVRALLDRVENDGLPAEENTWQPWRYSAAILYSESPERTKALLRRECEGESADDALRLLARLRDPADEQRIVKWIAADSDGAEYYAAALWGTPPITQALLSREKPDKGLLALSQCGFWFGVEEDEPGHADWEAALMRGDAGGMVQSLLFDAAERHGALMFDREHRPQPWLERYLRRCFKLREHEQGDVALGLLAIRDPKARAQYWAAMRAGRYRWINDWQDERAMTLGFDWVTLPFWAEELESNCCRINPRIDSMFEKLFGIDELYRANDLAVGLPPSWRVRFWFEHYGGDPRWSEIAQTCLPVPE